MAAGPSGAWGAGPEVWGAEMWGAEASDAGVLGAEAWDAEMWDAEASGAEVLGAGVWGAWGAGPEAWGAEAWGAGVWGAWGAGPEASGAEAWDAEAWGSRVSGAEVSGAGPVSAQASYSGAARRIAAPRRAHARHALEVGQQVVHPSARAAVESEVTIAPVQPVAQGQARIGIILAGGKAQNGQVRREGEITQGIEIAQKEIRHIA